MKRSWELKPNLLDCILEERIAPAIANLGVIALTTSGFSLVTPFPGASNSSSGSLGTSSTGQSSAASVSGAAMPTSFYVTGNRGISTFLPGNFTGNPAIGGVVTGAGGGLGLTIQVGSGADEAGGPSPSPSAARSHRRGRRGRPRRSWRISARCHRTQARQTRPRAKVLRPRRSRHPCRPCLRWVWSSPVRRAGPRPACPRR